MALAACSGKVVKTPIVDNQGNPVMVSYLFGMYQAPAYSKTKYSRTAVIENASATKIAAIANNSSNFQSACLQILETSTTTASGESEKFRAFSSCISDENTAKLVAYASGNPATDIQYVSRDTQASIKSVQEGLTKRVLGVASTSQQAVGIGLIVNGLKSMSNDRRDENIASVENSGDTIVNGLSVDASQRANGGVASGSGALGSPTSEANGSVSGDGSTVTLNIGRGLANTANDNARQFVGTRATQQLDSSANGAVNDNSNVDQQPVIDDVADTTFNNEPNNAVNDGTREASGGNE